MNYNLKKIAFIDSLTDIDEIQNDLPLEIYEFGKTSDNRPTLIIGTKYAKSIIGRKFDVFKANYDNIFWSPTIFENRKLYEENLLAFQMFALNRILNEYGYKTINPIIYEHKLQGIFQKLINNQTNVFHNHKNLYFVDCNKEGRKMLYCLNFQIENHSSYEIIKSFTQSYGKLVNISNILKNIPDVYKPLIVEPIY